MGWRGNPRHGRGYGRDPFPEPGPQRAETDLRDQGDLLQSPNVFKRRPGTRSSHLRRHLQKTSLRRGVLRSTLLPFLVLTGTVDSRPPPSHASFSRNTSTNILVHEGSAHVGSDRPRARAREKAGDLRSDDPKGRLVYVEGRVGVGVRCHFSFGGLEELGHARRPTTSDPSGTSLISSSRRPTEESRRVRPAYPKGPSSKGR